MFLFFLLVDIDTVTFVPDPNVIKTVAFLMMTLTACTVFPLILFLQFYSKNKGAIATILHRAKEKEGVRSAAVELSKSEFSHTYIPVHTDQFHFYWSVCKCKPTVKLRFVLAPWWVVSRFFWHSKCFWRNSLPTILPSYGIHVESCWRPNVFFSEYVGYCRLKNINFNNY